MIYAGALAFAACLGVIAYLLAMARRQKEEAHFSTQELALRNVLLGAITGPLEDEEAYSRVVLDLQARFSAAEVLLAWFDGAGNLRASSLGARPPQGPLGEDAARELAEALDGKAPSWFDPGLCLFARRLESDGQLVGYVLLGRRERAYSPFEARLLATVFALFSGPILTRKTRAAQELVRQEAESSLRRSEERLQTFFDESGDMIYSSNADDIVASINATGLSLLGVTDRFEVLGQPFSRFALSPEDRQFFLGKIKDQGRVDDYEIVLRKQDGSVTFCIESARAVRDAEGRLVEIQGIVKDITERIERERQLWKINMDLAEANSELNRTHMLMVQHEKLASIGQLAAGVAHEINNPLGFLKSNQDTLSSYLRTMRKAWEAAVELDGPAHGRISERFELGYIFEESNALMRESDEGFRRIMDIVMNLRTFSRQEGSSAKAPYDLNKGIESTLVMARNEIKYVADVELDLGPIAPVKAAGGELNQVLLNLLVNSAQAIEGQKRKEKGRILIKTREEGGKVLLVIADDGPGIPEDLRLQVFDPFFTTKDPGKGTGLGLSISYDIIVRKHGGAISIGASSLGGAEFRIELPILGAGREAGPEGLSLDELDGR